MKTNSINEDRFHSLDAVRACALLGGILLHALMSYMPGFREANWPLSDNSTNAGLGVLYFVIHLFRMSLFFLIAGFFARLLQQRLGTKGLIKNRLRRLGLPLIAFYFLVLPFAFIAFIWGMRQLGIPGAGKNAAFPPVIGPPVPWFHLWFLYLLLFICLLVVAMRALVIRLDTGGTLSSTVSRLLGCAFSLRIAPVLLGAPVAVSMFFSPWWVQWNGVPSPIVGLVPNFPGLLAYGTAFLVGWFVQREQENLRILASDWHLYALGAVAGTAVALYVVGITPKFGIVELSSIERAVYAGAYMFAQWCGMFAVIGLAVRYLQAPSARWRYLADASYWMYLVHFPIVLLLQAWMLRWPLHWSIKLSMVLVITSVLLFTSYHYLVRSTFMGVFLNGRKYPRVPGN
ncbi:acyltransferase family protein [Pseudoduganella sp. SL102]|uniref:acyltransferase family protein n=1 Tax=Pseudoduganella sp. SL102 TaxID=2995154 RepID=UPI00248CE73A|nr:acyltransferase family protein [Pseudoduganella sp. SL102]WBS02910.1 acyltransferase family protein [Pseudoduganella sp. SL102]